jgi:hypothetical protein
LARTLRSVEALRPTISAAPRHPDETARTQIFSQEDRKIGSREISGFELDSGGKPPALLPHGCARLETQKSGLCSSF